MKEVITCTDIREQEYKGPVPMDLFILRKNDAGANLSGRMSLMRNENERKPS